MALRELHDRDEKIAAYSKTVVSIDHLLKRRKTKLENRLARFEEELNVMRKELQAGQLRLEKLEREKVFESLYFDKSTRGTKG